MRKAAGEEVGCSRSRYRFRFHGGWIVVMIGESEPESRESERDRLGFPLRDVEEGKRASSSRSRDASIAACWPRGECTKDIDTQWSSEYVYSVFANGCRCPRVPRVQLVVVSYQHR